MVICTRRASSRSISGCIGAVSKPAAKAWPPKCCPGLPIFEPCRRLQHVIALDPKPPKLMNAAVHHLYRVGRIALSVVALEVMELRLWEKRAIEPGDRPLESIAARTDAS